MDRLTSPSLAPAPIPTSSYVELWCRSHFSFLRGASSPRALVERAKALGHTSLAITDCDGLYGMVRAHEAAKEAEVRLLVGTELTVGTRSEHVSVVALVQNHTGYKTLCQLLTLAHAGARKGRSPGAASDLPHNSYAEISAEALSQRTQGLTLLFPVGPRMLAHERHTLDLLRQTLGTASEQLFLETHRPLDGTCRARSQTARRASLEFGLPIVATNAVRFAAPEDKPVHDVLTCIREGLRIEQAGRRLLPNAEQHLKAEATMQRLFADEPSWLTRSVEIAHALTFSLTELRYSFPSETDASFAHESQDQRLARLTQQGLARRYPQGTPASVLAQIEKELSLIASLKVAPYFLSVHDIVEMARGRDILCQGRGSAANSAVCFALGITAVDPARSSMLFERFLSPDRHEPPDIDVDFEHERREEVIQDIYAKYGRDHAAMVSEVICYRGKSALREVAKVFGCSPASVDALSQLVTWWDTPNDAAHRASALGLTEDPDRLTQVFRIAQAIQGTPRHLSIHVGGFVVSAEPLHHIAPIEPATMPGRTVIPWDKDDLDTLGFFKIDVLGLGILSAIRKALDMTQHAPALSAPSAQTSIERLAKIPAEDPAVYDALCLADTIGVFQIESRAQMSMLPRLKPRCFYDIVVQVAIVRPGPIQGGMVHPFIRRRAGKESAAPPHPILGPTLERTLGVPLFQEQVMQLAIVGAGYSPGEADQLRRDMAAWKRHGRLDRHRARLQQGFAKHGISSEVSERIYKQIEGFAEYGFPESHAASFALLVYASAWLKTHHPAAFAAALINSQPMGFYSPSTLLQDAQRHGVVVRPIDVQRSDWDCTIERDGPAPYAIRVGLRQVSGLKRASAERLLLARTQGPWQTVEDLRHRAALNVRETEFLAEAGALEPLVEGRRRALWKARAPSAGALFRGKSSEPSAPLLPRLTRTDQLLLDFGRTGFSLSDHPLSLLRHRLPSAVSAKQLGARRTGEHVVVAGMSICRQRPATASGVVFMSLEDETGLINVVLWKDVFERYRSIATHSSLLQVEGKLQIESGTIHVIAAVLTPLHLPKPLPSVSRDFH